MLTTEELLGKWITAVFEKHFKEQREEQADKIFIKVSGLTETDVKSTLLILEEKKEELIKHYEPIIRTISTISGYEKYQFQEHETSTWLRNNTKPNKALILIINDTTPEGQSLENIFSIDESYLLSKDGITILYAILAGEYKYAAEEIKELKSFLLNLNKVIDPQLRTILSFLVEIINDASPSIINKIKKHLPKLYLFRDSELNFQVKDVARLKKNYMLSNLQKNSSNLEPEVLLDKLHLFMDTEEKNNWMSELWENTDPETFKEEATDFIYQKNSCLLKYELSLIEHVFNFKISQGLIDQVKDVFDLENKSNGEREKIEAGIDALSRDEDPEEIQAFLEEFEDELKNVPGLVKKITRIIEKKRHPSEYYDIYDALLYESFALIEENNEQLENENIKFVLKLVSNISESSRDLLRIYLKDIHKYIEYLYFEESTLPIEIDSSVKNTDVTLELSLHSQGNILGKKKFRINDFADNQAYSLIEYINADKLPQIKSYLEKEIEIVDIVKKVQEDTQYYMASNELEMRKHLNEFLDFSTYYLALLKDSLKKGLFSIVVEELDQKLEKVLNNVYDSVSVTKHIYRFINEIGTIDSYEVKKGQYGSSIERVLTIFNPIRLSSYLHRFKEMNDIINDWIQRANRNELEVSKFDNYLTFIIDQNAKLSPRYFVSEDESSYLIEVENTLGNGKFILNTKPVTSNDYLANEVSKELTGVIKNYFEVYPYAKDGLDILFLYCQSVEVVTKTIDEVFKKYSSLSKLKLTVHSTQAAKLHKDLNKWVSLKEEYNSVGLNKKFPKLEINVLSGCTINDVSSQIKDHMIDADLVVLLDYFGQNGQVHYKLEKVKPSDSHSWFEEPYKEPLLTRESIKRIPYVSQKLPSVLQLFYQMQYISQSNTMPDREELHLLNATISASNFRDSALIDFMHENFNWIMIMDRFLDKSLLQQASNKAQIIQYKSKAGKNKNFKLILSSSQYVRKINSNIQDYAYYDRLNRKLTSILKNENINRETVIDAVNRVKDISGALVLKVIGPGKYAHEMLATYLTLNSNEFNEGTLTIWSVCDELPWFASNQRRPDLVRTSIYKQGNDVKIDFELIELKFINHTILDRERFDALKQVRAGRNEYEKFFKFDLDNTDSQYWKDELLHYFIERDAYTPEQAEILKELQHISPKDIKVNIEGSVHAYCYTSNLLSNGFESVEEGVFVDQIDEEIKNYIFNRHYILNVLGATEEVIPEYTELFVDSKEQEILTDTDNHIDEKETETKQEYEQSNEYDREKEKNSNEIIIEDKIEFPQQNDLIEDKDVSVISDYPEVKALQGLDLNKVSHAEDNEELKNHYSRLLVRNFAKNNIRVNVTEAIVGSSVIRLILEIPSDVQVNKIINKEKDIQYWLGLNTEPHIFISKSGINIDIVREHPETIYFEEFMELTREQLGHTIHEKNLIVPLGLDPLNKVISIDLADSITPHLLVGGTTGSGKSVTLNSIILGIMSLYDPETVQFLFIDPKQVEFNFYQGKPHTQKVITDIEEAVIALEDLTKEMDNRYSILNKEYVSNLEEYISVTGKKMPRIVVIFDEFADFMSQDKETAKRVENAIQRIGQKARAAGIHLIICTQYPKAEIINTKIRGNLPARLALRAADATASTVILDQDGAEKLAGKGDFLAKYDSSPVRGKSPFLTPEVKRALLKYFDQLNYVSASRD